MKVTIEKRFFSIITLLSPPIITLITLNSSTLSLESDK